MGHSQYIKIIACKNILEGDELTYDYKFQFAEDGEEKLPCFCGSEKCKGFLNWY